LRDLHVHLGRRCDCRPAIVIIIVAATAGVAIAAVIVAAAKTGIAATAGTTGSWYLGSRTFTFACSLAASVSVAGVCVACAEWVALTRGQIATVAGFVGLEWLTVFGEAVLHSLEQTMLLRLR
jgi:hypothetical protein